MKHSCEQIRHVEVVALHGPVQTAHQPCCRLLGKANFSLKDLGASEDAYRRAKDMDGHRPDAFRGLAEVHEQLENNEELVEDYRALVSAAGPVWL